MTTSDKLDVCLYRLKEQAEAAHYSMKLEVKKILLDGIEKELHLARVLLTQCLLEENQHQPEAWL